MRGQRASPAAEQGRACAWNGPGSVGKGGGGGGEGEGRGRGGGGEGEEELEGRGYSELDFTLRPSGPERAVMCGCVCMSHPT